ncbi:PEP/pyruvate-binding domain-containing protein [Micromonospora sp. NPDC004551]|uniref:PEP/pyruvate-binding domain-containing protein n=1 Tax=Micromonospora sp. NPDC004551 TaxID=3154284 RepID=UPI0033B25832
MPLVRSGPALADPTVVGHKFARQQVLREAGFPVPPFFCVPAEEFDRVSSVLAEPVPPADRWPAELDGWAARRRAAVREHGVPDELGRAVLAEFDRLVGPDGLVAVRSCAVAGGLGAEPGEDSAVDPAAGMTDSYLYVPRDQVLGRVAECWASACTDRAVRYRAHRGLAVDGARIAVGVQRMVDGRRSFVVFTRDPRDGGDRQLVAAAHGTGEGVVQERADIDHFFRDPATDSVRAAVVVKRRMTVRDPERAGAVRDVPVPAQWAGRPVLDDDEVRRVCRLAERVERVFGAPQDIEGTLTEDGEIHLVQARPVVLAAAAGGNSHDPAPARTVTWTNHNLTESFPGVTCALTFAQAREFYRLAFGDFYRRMGVPAEKRRRRTAELASMIGTLDGRVYYRLDSWLALHGMLPGFALLGAAWQRGLGLSTAELPDPPPPAHPGRLLLRTAPALARAFLPLPGQVRRFLRWWDERYAQNADLDGLDPDELVARYRALWAEFGERWGVTLVGSYLLLASVGTVEWLLRRWAPDHDRAVLAGLLAGGPENRSLAGVRSAVDLADRMRDTPGLPELLRAGDDRETWRQIAEGRFGADLAEAMRRHLYRYGDRAVHDLKLEERSPRQDPWRLLPTLAALVEQDRAAAAPAAGDADEVLRRVCPGPLRRAVLRRVVGAARWGVRVREDTRYCRSQLYGVTRDVMWRLGAALAAAGRLDDAGDVVHLSTEEVVGAVTGTLHEPDLRGLVARRRAALADSAGRPTPPAFLRLSPADLAAGVLPATGATEPAGPGGDGRVLHGLASSAGRARARARVVLDPTAAFDRTGDHILVARETDPGWLYLMVAAKGMVVERGSLMSHTAITGRLLGIPSVVAVPDATRVITDGSWIEVDGVAGTVRLLAEAEEAPAC